MSENAREINSLTPVVAMPTMRQGISMTEMLFNPERFEQAKKVARMFLCSPLVPDHIRGKNLEEGIANIIIALAMAYEMDENPIVVMQNIYFVEGKAGWNASYMIAKANRSGVFRGVIRWRATGTGPDLSVKVYATLASTGEMVSATADMKMAIAEGWTKNKKYTSMPEHMLCWRAATMLIRRYVPQVMLGYRTQDELQDMSAAGRLGDELQDMSAAGRLGAVRYGVPSSTEALMDALEIEVEPARPSEEYGDVLSPLDYDYAHACS